MKILVVFDSLYGNTKILAKEIAKSFPVAATEVIEVTEASLDRLLSADFIIFGSPTHGGQPKVAMKSFLEKIPVGALAGKKVAAFDTRFEESEQKLALKLLMKTIGYAAPKMIKTLKSKGALVAAEGEGFIVQGKKGLFRDGELLRAANWSAGLLQS